MGDVEKARAAGSDEIAIDLDEGLYPRDAVYGASYVFIDRCYVHLDRSGDRRIKVTLRPKRGVALDAETAAGEFQNELLGQAWRRLIAEENRQLIESITTRALTGAAGPPGLDELLALDIGAETAFEDPLGIAMSWEEKYGKKKSAAKAEPEAKTAPEATPAGEASPAEGTDEDRPTREWQKPPLEGEEP
jgi:His-Xaa-Ser system protein HxsD